MPNTALSPTLGSTMATATACLLQGALRELRSTSDDPASPQSTIIASNRSRVSLRRAASESLHKSTAISRSPRVRRRTLTIFSSEHSTIDFRLMISNSRLQIRNFQTRNFKPYSKILRPALHRCEPDRTCPEDSSFDFMAASGNDQSIRLDSGLPG